MHENLLKSLLQDIINDRTEQASVTMHDYFIAKTKEVSGLGTPVEEEAEELDEEVKTGKYVAKRNFSAAHERGPNAGVQSGAEITVKRVLDDTVYFKVKGDDYNYQTGATNFQRSVKAVNEALEEGQTVLNDKLLSAGYKANMVGFYMTGKDGVGKKFKTKEAAQAAMDKEKKKDPAFKATIKYGVDGDAGWKKLAEPVAEGQLNEWYHGDTAFDFILYAIRESSDFFHDHLRQLGIEGDDVAIDKYAVSLGFESLKDLKASCKEVDTEDDPKAAMSAIKRFSKTYPLAYSEDLDGYQAMIFSKKPWKKTKSQKFTLPGDMQKMLDLVEDYDE